MPKTVTQKRDKETKKQAPPQQLVNRVLELLRYDMIIAVGIALLLFVAGLGVGKYFLQRPVVQAKPLPSMIDLDCSNLKLPELQRLEAMVSRLNNKSTTVECVTELPFKYIQAPHNAIKYSISGGNLMVQADSLINDGKGVSMIPSFFEGNTLIMVKYYGQALKPGMIISYKDETGQKLVHRISSVYGNDIIVKGDANNAFDGSVDKEQVEGVVIGVLYT